MPLAKIGDVCLRYCVQGSGAPLLLIMGYRGSGFMWGDELITPLARFFQVITFDNRGTGLSDKPETLYTIPMMADDAAALLQHLGITRAHVFGVSMGGMIAQELALRHAQRVARLVLGCTTCGGPHAVLAPLPILARLLGLPHLPGEEAMRQQWPLIFSPAFLNTQAAFLDRLTARALRYAAPFSTSVQHLRAMQRFNTYGRLGQIVAPTLVLAGAADVLVPQENARLLARRISHAVLHILPDVGHGFFWEKPQEVIALLCDFSAPF